MIETILVDDEQNNIEILQSLVSKFCPEIKITGVANSLEQARELIIDLRPQLVFLDIEMPFGNAFTLLESLQPVNFEVIFVTAFDKYAVKAFKYSALDYLLKPLNIDDLKNAVHRVHSRISEKNVNTRIELLINNFKTEAAGIKKIALPTAKGLLFEDIENVMRLQAEGSYTYIFTKDGKREMVSKNLKEFEDILPVSFFCRLHHSHIVNINYIKKYYKGRGGYVELKDGTTVEVSSRKKEEFLERFGM